MPSADELLKKYRSMSEEELIRLLEQADTLTDNARSSLEIAAAESVDIHILGEIAESASFNHVGRDIARGIARRNFKCFLWREDEVGVDDVRPSPPEIAEETRYLTELLRAATREPQEPIEVPLERSGPSIRTFIRRVFAACAECASFAFLLLGMLTGLALTGWSIWLGWTEFGFIGAVLSISPIPGWVFWLFVTIARAGVWCNFAMVFWIFLFSLFGIGVAQTIVASLAEDVEASEEP